MKIIKNLELLFLKKNDLNSLSIIKIVKIKLIIQIFKINSKDGKSTDFYKIKGENLGHGQRHMKVISHSVLLKTNSTLYNELHLFCPSWCHSNPSPYLT